MTVGHRKSGDPGSKEASTPEGMMQGFRLRGADNISYWIADIMRNIEAGLRGFLVYDEGLLFILSKMREEGFIPKKTIFEFSVFGGFCSAAETKVIESVGVNTMKLLELCVGRNRQAIGPSRKRRLPCQTGQS